MTEELKKAFDRYDKLLRSAEELLRIKEEHIAALERVINAQDRTIKNQEEIIAMLKESGDALISTPTTTEH